MRSKRVAPGSASWSLREVSFGFAALAAILGFLLTACDAGAAAGDLNRSFADRGQRLIDFGGARDQALTVVGGRDGSVVVGGRVAGFHRNQYGAQMAFVGLRRDGRLDKSFGRGGFSVVKGWGNESSSSAQAMARQGRKIVGAGEVNRLGTGVVRLKPDGSLDRRFGSAGRQVVGVEYATQIHAVAVDSQRRVLVAGFVNGFGRRDQQAFVARLTPSGRPDRSFGVDGEVYTQFGTGENTSVFDLEVTQGDGVLVSGDIGSNWMVAELTEDGSVDSEFGDNGVAFAAPRLIGSATAVAVSRGGGIVAAGCDVAAGGPALGVARYASDGDSDVGFGDEGIARFDFGDSYDGWCAAGADVDSAGNITLGATAVKRGRGFPLTFGLLRLSPEGALDRGFGNGGKTVVSFGRLTGARKLAYPPMAMSAPAGGPITIVGYTALRRVQDMAIAQFADG